MFNRKRDFLAQRLSLSPSYRLDMTEMLLKGRKNESHPSIHPSVASNNFVLGSARTLTSSKGVLHIVVQFVTLLKSYLGVQIRMYCRGLITIDLSH